MLKPYIAYSRSEGSEACAILVIATSVKEAKKLAWGQCMNVDEWTDLAVRLIRDESVMCLADQAKLQEGASHVIEEPLGCEECGLWGAGLTDDSRCGYCGEHPGDVLVGLLTSLS